ncbi:MAG: nitroreductase family protein [Spirochaetaceae bacterium]|jgi:nitroreductase|nr:nitroreductase family protein [Spirochaetaceae bacterium]
MTITEAINARRSVRKYKDGDKPIPQDQLDLILEAAMKAPTANHLRPWRFIVVTNRDKLLALGDAHPYARMVKQASAAIIVCIPKEPGDEPSVIPQDCAAATENILLQATGLGLGTCWCGVFPYEERMAPIGALLGDALPAGFAPFNLIALGYPNEGFGSRGFYEKEKVIYVS